MTRVLHLLDHRKVGKVAMGETIRIAGNCESIRELLTGRQEETCCCFTTGFLNGVFSAITNQHIKETECIAMGNAYCE